MCLIICEKRTRNIKHRQQKEFYVYKWLRRYEKPYKSKKYVWTSPFQGTDYPYKGIKKSRRKKFLTPEEKKEKRVDYGLHVWLSYQAALKNKLNLSGVTLFKVKVNLDDLIAVGNKGDAVFTKLYFDESVIG